jgi:hypothetical protein
MASILVVVYLVLGVAGGILLSLNYDFAYPLAQVSEAVWHGAVWMLVTSMFLRANPFHLFRERIVPSNFRNFTGRASVTSQMADYFSCGLMGSVVFLSLGATPLVWGLRTHFVGCLGLQGE